MRSSGWPWLHSWDAQQAQCLIMPQICVLYDGRVLDCNGGRFGMKHNKGPHCVCNLCYELQGCLFFKS